MVKVAEVNQWIAIIIQTIQFCVSKFIEDVGHLADKDDFINQLVLLRSYLSQLQGAIHYFDAICYDSGICSLIRIEICRNVSSRRIVSIADVYVIDLSKDGIISLCSWTLYCLGVFCLPFIRVPNVSNRVIERKVKLEYVYWSAFNQHLHISHVVFCLLVNSSIRMCTASACHSMMSSSECCCL